MNHFALKEIQDKVVVRLPLIESYNDDEDRKESMSYLQAMGFTKFDLFTYKTPKQ